MLRVAVMYLLLIPEVALFIHTRHNGMKVLPVVLKALCTATILLTGLIWTFGPPENANIYGVLISAGLFLGLMADVAICINFLSGMLFFALGHLCYIAAILRVSSHAQLAVPIFAVIYLAVIVLFRGSGLSPGKLLIPVAVYSVIITVMLSLAATVPFSAPVSGSVLLSGASLFTVSDAMLACITFGRPDKKLDTICLYCYFIGQSLFAVSIFCLR